MIIFTFSFINCVLEMIEACDKVMLVCEQSVRNPTQQIQK